MRVILAIVLALAASLSASAAQLSLVAQLPTGARAAAIKTDATGAVYVSGTIPPDQPRGVDDAIDAFIAKYDPVANRFVYFVRIGGSLNDWAYGLAVDASGAAYFTGAGSFDIPVTVPQTSLPQADTVVAIAGKLDPTGKIVYLTTFAGATPSAGSGIAVNAAGEAFITGTIQTNTGIPPFPATSGAAVNVNNLAYVAKLDANGNLVFVNRGIGGAAVDLDAQGNIFVAGAFSEGGAFSPSNLPDPPTTPGAFQTQRAKQTCAANQLFTVACTYTHIAKLDPSGQNLLFATFLAGQFGAQPTSIVVDPSGAVYIAGGTSSSDYPVTDGAARSTYTPIISPFPFLFRPQTGFLSKLNADGSGLLFSTYLGGSQTDLIGGIALYNGQIYASAYTQSPTFPGAENVNPRCLPAVVLFRVSQDGKSVDQVRGHPFSPTESTQTTYPIAIAFDNQGSTYSTIWGNQIFRSVVTDSQTFSCTNDAGTFNITHTVAPGQILSVFGSPLAPTVAAANPALGGQLPTSLGNLTVDFDGISAPLLYASPDQFNVVVPFEVAAKSQVTMTATAHPTQGPTTVVMSDILQITARNPSVFLSENADTSCVSVATTDPIPVVRNADGSLTTCATPAAAGSVVRLYLNGGGLASSALTTGNISTQATPVGVPVTANLYDVPQTPLQVLNVSLEPGSVSSVWRVDLQIPANLSGWTSRDIVVQVDGIPLPGPYLVIFTKP